MTVLYEISPEGGIEFVSHRKSWDVNIPAYVYDIWMPLLGSDVIGVYAIYCRLERAGKIQGMGIKKIATAARKGDKTVVATNLTLQDCEFIVVEKPEGWERLAHFTTRIVLLDPPMSISAETIEKYRGSGAEWEYQPLTDWLVNRTNLPEASNDDTESVKRRRDKASNDDTNIDSSILESSILSSGDPTNSFDSNRRGGARRPTKDTSPVNPRQEVSSSKVDYSQLNTTPLVQYVMQELKDKTFTINKKIGKLLTESQIVQDGLVKITYAGPAELYKDDATFQEFVKERMGFFSSRGDSTVENCLLNICRFSRQDGTPSVDGKRKLQSYHFWKATFTSVASLDDTLSMAAQPPEPEDWQEEDFFEKYKTRFGDDKNETQRQIA